MVPAAAQKYALPLAVFILTGLILWTHLWALSDLPRGLYVDETSIGINAARIAESGVDEHGEAWPIFFKAFGEYKNPVAIYATAVLFWLTSPSVLGLRIVSALFFFTFLVGLTSLAWRLFRHPLPTLFVVGSAAFLPWFFPVSRIAFEVISQLTVTVFALLCLYEAHHRSGSRRAQLIFALGAGALLAATVYTYSTSRLLAFASVGIWGLLYARQAKAHYIAGLIGFIIVLLPYGIFSVSHPGALTARFHTISYLSDDTLTIAGKAVTFGTNYLYHFTPEFLLITGDKNLRHATGHGGALFATVLILSMIGLFASRQFSEQRFILFLGLLGLCAPIPAALTIVDGGIVTRTLLLGLTFILFAGYGVKFLFRFHRTVIYALGILLVLEASAYMVDYFTDYPQRSVIWFETYNVEGALQIALAQQPTKIIVSPNAHQAATNLAFYQAAIPNPRRVPISLSPPAPEPNTCVIFFNTTDETILRASSLPWRELTPPNSMAKVRCY